MTIMSSAARRPSLVGQEELSDFEDEDDYNNEDNDDDDDVEMVEREDTEPESEPEHEHGHRQGSVPIAASRTRILGPAPWTSNNLVLDYNEPPRSPIHVTLPEIKRAPRAQADTNSQLDSYLHFLTGHTYVHILSPTLHYI